MALCRSKRALSQGDVVELLESMQRRARTLAQHCDVGTLLMDVEMSRGANMEALERASRLLRQFPDDMVSPALLDPMTIRDVPAVVKECRARILAAIPSTSTEIVALANVSVVSQ